MSAVGCVCWEVHVCKGKQDPFIYIDGWKWEQMDILLIGIKASGLSNLQWVKPSPSLLVYRLYIMQQHLDLQETLDAGLGLGGVGGNAGIKICLRMTPAISASQ